MCALILMLLMLGGAHAQSDAFTDEVAIADRSDSEQSAAFLVAMRRVLLRNSGDKTLLNRDDIRAGLANAEDYVESVAYRTPEVGQVIGRDVSVTDRVRATGKATQLMSVSFNSSRIRQLIARKGNASSTTEPAADQSATPFASVRQALVWLLIDDNGEDVLVGGSSGEKIVRRANEIAGGLGLTLTFPFVDSADQANLTADDLRSVDLEKIIAASTRYGQQIIAVADLSRARTGGWTGRWTRFTADGQSEESSVTSTSLDAALQTGLGWLRSPDNAAGTATAFQLGNTSGPTQSEALIWVSSINSVASYADVLKFMASVNNVSIASVKEISVDGMVFSISPRSSVRDVVTALSSIDWLRQTGAPASVTRSALAGNVELSLDYLR